MDDLLKSITEYSAWPMVHVFIPSIIAIYNKNIFVLISIIYLFESAEFFFAILTGLEYWSDIGANALISDIIMGLTGFWLIQIIGETEYKHEKIPWYAVLKYREGYWKWYEKFQPYLHVLLGLGSAAPMSILITMEILPENMPHEFILFGSIFIFVAFLFGKDRFAKYSAILITVISALSITIGYTPIFSFGVVFGYFFSTHLIKKYLDDYEKSHPPTKSYKTLKDHENKLLTF